MAGIAWYPGRRRKLDGDVRKALEMTASEVLRDIRQEQTMPRRTGELNERTFVDRSGSSEGRVSIVSDTPYARRLYYHPEYEFYQGINRQAGAGWFEPYKKGGSRSQWARDTFGKLLRRGRGA